MKHQLTLLTVLTAAVSSTAFAGLDVNESSYIQDTSTEVLTIHSGGSNSSYGSSYNNFNSYSNGGGDYYSNVKLNPSFEQYPEPTYSSYSEPSFQNYSGYSSSSGSSDYYVSNYHQSTNPAWFSNYSGGSLSSPSSSSNSRSYDAIITEAASRHGVDPALVKAIIHTESNFDPYAISHAGAQGLMQLMPATADRFYVYNVFDPKANIEGGTEYIAWLLRRFNYNVEYAVAGYNAGEGNVSKYGGIPPFSETQNYVRRVMGRYNNLYKYDSDLTAMASNYYNAYNEFQ